MLKVIIKDHSDDFNSCNELIVEHNGKEIISATDYCNIGDNSFLLHYSWIKPIIEKAYNFPNYTFNIS